MNDKPRESQKPIVCIGGANVDRKYHLTNKIIEGTSNPITSSTTVGGVARNIAENLGRLGEEVLFISVKGNDLEWKEIESASSPYMNISEVEMIDCASTGSYTAVLNQKGEMTVAYADMGIFNYLSPSLLKTKEHIFKNAKCIIVDLNCSKETILYLNTFCMAHEIPYIVIPVSSPKMDRLPGSLKDVACLIVNKDESETYLNMTLNDQSDWKKSVERWLDLGYERVIVTHGENGVMAGQRNDAIKYFAAVDTKEVIDVTGAGDSFCAAVIYYWLHKKSFEEVIRGGLVNAHHTILSKHTVRKELSAKRLRQEMEELF